MVQGGQETQVCDSRYAVGVVQKWMKVPAIEGFQFWAVATVHLNWEGNRGCQASLAVTLAKVWATATTSKHFRV